MQHTYKYVKCYRVRLLKFKSMKELEQSRRSSMRVTGFFSHFEDTGTKRSIHRWDFGEVLFLEHANLKLGISFKSNLFSP